MANLCGIYKITCLPTNQCYIGQSIRIRGRLNQHKSDLKQGKHNNKFLQGLFNKYGFDNFAFEIIELCSIDELDEKEKTWITYYGGVESKMNCNFESGGHANKTYSAEIKKAKSEKYKGVGLPYGEKTRFKKGRTPWNKGLKMPKELKDKLSKVHKGKYLSEETKKKLSAINKGKRIGKDRYNSKAIIMFNKEWAFLKEFDSMNLAAKYVGGNSGGIARAIKRKGNYKGYKWKYIGE